MAKALGLDDFMGHKTRGGGGKFLKNWRKDPGWIDAWLHTRAPIMVVWTHGFPQIRVFEDKQTKQMQRRVWTGNYNCWEDEEILKKQYRLDDEGQREDPPEVCPDCKLIEWVRGQVRSGKLKWTDPIMAFTGDRAEENVILHAGGVYNAFGARDLTDRQKDELKAAGIYQNKAWRENAIAKAQYVFAVVNHADPASGVQITTEASLLGDKVRSVISDARMALGDSKGNPMLHPYAIKWIYRENEPQFDKKYHAVRLEYPCTDAVRKLITGQAPDLSHYTDPFDAKAQLAVFQKHWTHKVKPPWGEVFDAAIKLQEEGGRTAPRSSGDDESASDDAPQSNRTPEVGTGASTESTDDDDLVACDKCEKPMKISDPACPHCGFVYEVVEAPPPPPPPKRTRSQVQAEKAAAQAAPPPAKKQAKAPPPPPEGGDEDDDDVPF